MPEVVLDICSIRVNVTKEELTEMKKCGNIPESVTALALAKVIEMAKNEPIIYNFEEE
jgi:hypothetical protein